MNEPVEVFRFVGFLGGAMIVQLLSLLSISLLLNYAEATGRALKPKAFYGIVLVLAFFVSAIIYILGEQLYGW